MRKKKPGQHLESNLKETAGYCNCAVNRISKVNIRFIINALSQSSDSQTETHVEKIRLYRCQIRFGDTRMLSK